MSMKHGGDLTLDALLWAIQSALNDAVGKFMADNRGDAELLEAGRLAKYARELQAFAEEELDWRCDVEEAED